MLCHAIGHQVLPTQLLPREAEDFPRGDKYFNHVSLLTANLLPTKWYYLVGFIYVLGAAAECYINLSLVLNSLY